MCFSSTCNYLSGSRWKIRSHKGLFLRSRSLKITAVEDPLNFINTNVWSPDGLTCCAKAACLSHLIKHVSSRHPNLVAYLDWFAGPNGLDREVYLVFTSATGLKLLLIEAQQNHIGVFLNETFGVLRSWSFALSAWLT